MPASLPTALPPSGGIVRQPVPCHIQNRPLPAIPVDDDSRHRTQARLADLVSARDGTRQRRGADDDMAGFCQRTGRRALAWGRSLGQRLQSVADGLQRRPAAPHATDVAAATPTAPPAPPPTAQGTDNTPLPLLPGTSINSRGFIERADFGLLYLVVQVTTLREQSRPGRPANTPIHPPPERHGLQPQQSLNAGRRALDGPLVEAYLSPEAARRAAQIHWGDADGSAYPMYVITAHGLHGVSFGENRARNPDYVQLMRDDLNDWNNVVRVGPDYSPYSAHHYRSVIDYMVQLRLESGMKQRLSRMPEQFTDP